MKFEAKNTYSKQASPWGTTQIVTSFTRGLAIVHTASHGGYRVSRGFAEKHLSKEALERAIIYGHQYFYFEEDCDASIVDFEMLEKFGQDFGEVRFNNGEDKEFVRRYLLLNLKYYNFTYVLKRNLPFTMQDQNRYKTKKIVNFLRETKDSRLIISAIRETDTITKVTTADGQDHLVKGSSYNYRDHRFNLLKKCVVL